MKIEISVSKVVSVFKETRIRECTYGISLNLQF